MLQRRLQVLTFSGRIVGSLSPSAYAARYIQENTRKLRPQGRSMYRVTQEIEFCYGHRLMNYDGKCRHLHGHNGRAVIVLENDELDERGMLIDFSDVKRSLRAWIEDNLDHRMILRDDDPAIPMLREMGEPLLVIAGNPTAENIATLIFEQAVRFGFPVVEVSLWEILTFLCNLPPAIGA